MSSLRLLISASQPARKNPNVLELHQLDDLISRNLPGLSTEVVRRALSISDLHLWEVVNHHRRTVPATLTMSQYSRCIRTIKSGAAQRLAAHYQRQDELAEVAHMKETIKHYRNEIDRMRRLISRLLDAERRGVPYAPQ